MKTERLFKTPLGEAQKRNSEKNHVECSSGKTVLESYPRRIVFELTNKCNFQCVMCGRESADFKTSDLPVSVIKSFRSFFQFAEETTLHGWGEGTLHPKLPEILEYLNTFPLLRKYFVTNGSTLPKIMESVFEHHVDLIAVSLDGVTPGTNDSIRKGGDLKREVRSIKRILLEKERRNLDYPYVNLVFTAMARNIHELPGMVRLAYEMGVPEVKAVYLTIFNDGLRKDTLFDRQELVKRHFIEAREAAERLNIYLKLPELQGESDAGDLAHKPCAFPWRDFYIGSDTFVRPCQSSAERLLSVKDFRTPEDAWNSKDMQNIRLSVNDARLMPASCRNCYHSTCANWNLKKSFLQLNNSFAPEWGAKDTVIPAAAAPVASAEPKGVQ
ncbi:MAG: radical SAM protein [Deltaproteobacteria bacterium]|nr:radical SAM protein [Deltaproteobacteria bacterium]